MVAADKETVEGRFDFRKATTADSISALIFVLRSARRK